MTIKTRLDYMQEECIENSLYSQYAVAEIMEHYIRLAVKLDKIIQSPNFKPVYPHRQVSNSEELKGFETYQI